MQKTPTCIVFLKKHASFFSRYNFISDSCRENIVRISDAEMKSPFFKATKQSIIHISDMLDIVQSTTQD